MMVECGICLEQYQEGEIELHRKICVLWLMFRCNICSEDYVNKEGLWNHLDLHEISDESKEAYYREIKAKHRFHECLLCNDKRAYSKCLYDNHVHDVHNGLFLQCSDSRENFRSEQVKNEHAFDQCKVRDQTLASGVYVDQATFNVENKDSEAKHLEAANTELKMEIKVEDTVLQEQKYQLSNEEKGHSSLMTHSSIQKHMDVHPENVNKKSNPIETGINTNENCPEEGGEDPGESIILQQSATELSEHPKNANDRDTSLVLPAIQVAKKSASCLICGQTFLNRYQWNYHQRVFHTEPQYKCLQCSKMFHFESGLRRHKLSHDRRQNHIDVHAVNAKKKGQPRNKPNKLAPCLICGIKFRSKIHKKYHMRHVHMNPQFKCSLCSKMFHFRGNLRRHEEAHGSILDEGCTESSLKCPQCDKSFIYARMLQRHMKVHTAKVSPCSVCGITFPTPHKRNYHLRVSHTEPQHKCSQCSKVFHYIYALHRHEKAMHHRQSVKGIHK